MKMKMKKKKKNKSKKQKTEKGNKTMTKQKQKQKQKKKATEFRGINLNTWIKINVCSVLDNPDDERDQLTALGYSFPKEKFF